VPFSPGECCLAAGAKSTILLIDHAIITILIFIIWWRPHSAFRAEEAGDGQAGQARGIAAGPHAKYHPGVSDARKRVARKEIARERRRDWLIAAGEKGGRGGVVAGGQTEVEEGEDAVVTTPNKGLELGVSIAIQASPGGAA